MKWVPYRNENPEDDVSDKCIPAHSSIILSFREQYHFDWGHKALGGKRLYLLLHIAGNRKASKFLVYKG
ncbi:hypothetical protein THMIRHAS_19220 [Thiosulfatimonas sediminis]|uniref:Uncharacterized protein n=1 Tax=Thiosulfatimonas sediminis TaxID=2675054 RepID=A0A6F8PWQ4_9GAMM|nr:hypothetical protein [Thiosulfatimonas sediminis]BBP46549.1 hypothetical protein THMIRHAS_19220 [Thiosulfatimonas sediminis]